MSPSTSEEGAPYDSASDPTYFSPEISEFNAYFYFIISWIYIAFFIAIPIINICFSPSFWYIGFVWIIPVASGYFSIKFFKLRQAFLRILTFGLACLSYVLMFVSNSILWMIYIVGGLGILVFIKNYRDTRFQYARKRR